VATGRWGEGGREVAAQTRTARRGAAAAVAVGLAGVASGVWLGLPEAFTAIAAAVVLAAVWRVLDPRWSEHVRDALRLIGRKSD
jgi:hypothetical protein